MLPNHAALLRLLSVALLASVALLWAATVFAGASGPFLGDFQAYWQAGERIRSGEPLYFTPADHADSTIYRYAPWFAWVWALLTLLPVEVVQAGWLVLNVVGGAYALWPVRKHPAVLLLGPSMLAACYYGNVQALMVAALLYGLPRRAGPAWIALAASLKATPILFVLIYLGQRDWSRAAATLGLTAFLVAPMLLYDLSEYPVSGQFVGLSAEAPLLWAATAGAAGVASLLFSRTIYAPLAGASAALLALPRFAPYEVTVLAVGVAEAPNPSQAMT